jgi:hypothetical protein
VEKYAAGGNKRSASGTAEDGLVLVVGSHHHGGHGAATASAAGDPRGSFLARIKASTDAFNDPEIESLFQQYYLKQKRADFQVSSYLHLSC